MIEADKSIDLFFCAYDGVLSSVMAEAIQYLTATSFKFPISLRGVGPYGPEASSL